MRDENLTLNGLHIGGEKNASVKVDSRLSFLSDCMGDNATTRDSKPRKKDRFGLDNREENYFNIPHFLMYKMRKFNSIHFPKFLSFIGHLTI